MKPIESTDLNGAGACRVDIKGPFGPIHIDGSMSEYNPVPGFSVGDRGLDWPDTVNEFDFLNVIVRLLDGAGHPFEKSAYEAAEGVTIDYFALPELIVDPVHDGRNDFLSIGGTMAQINLALAGLALMFRGERDQACQLQVVIESCWQPASVAGFNWYEESVPDHVLDICTWSVMLWVSCNSDDDEYA